MRKQPVPPDHVHPLDERFMRWTRRQVMECIRADEPDAAEAALLPIWDRVERSSRFADSAFAEIQRMRDLGVLYDDEGACLLNEIYEYRSDYYQNRDAEHRRIIAEVGERFAQDASYTIEGSPEAVALQARERELRALYFRARGELTLAERTLADDPALVHEFYDGERSLVLDKQPMPVIEPPEAEWVALIRERIAALVNAEDAPTTFELFDRLHDVLQQASPASGIEAVQQLREVGLISRNHAFALVDQMVGELVWDAYLSDREAARWYRLREGLQSASTHSYSDESVDAAFERRSNQLRVWYLRQFGEHEMAELLRRDPAAYEAIVERVPFSDWFEARMAERERE